MPRILDSAKLTLSYPLYACDFDPEDATILAVGGGGGIGKSGVGNKITVLNTSNPNELLQTAEIDLSSDEDSVTSLAVGQSKGMTTPIYAGINSSEKIRQEGRNEHFRIFGLQAPSKATGAKISQLSRSMLFESKEKETYQRILRLSPPFQDSSQLGAAATAFASKEEEIVLFDPAKFSLGGPNIRGRIKIDKEAEDLDVIQTGKDEYIFAYCTKYDIFLKTISSTTTTEDPVHITPPTAEHERESKPVYRSIRFLSPRFLLVLTNLHNRKGASLLVLRLPSKEGDRANLALSKRLPSHVRQATGLAVRNLSPPTTPSSEIGYAQFVIAVAGHDSSVSIYTLEHQREGPVSMASLLKPLHTINNVHPFQITGIALSAFNPSAEKTSQNLKLASISAGNTVVVHTIPLSSTSKNGPPRYVVSGSTDSGLFTFNNLSSIVLVVTFAFVLQVILELRGSSPALLHASQHVAPDIQPWLRWDHPVPNAILGSPKPVISTTLPAGASKTPSHVGFNEKSFVSALEELISQAKSSEGGGKKPVVILREHPADPSGQGETTVDEKNRIKADLHDEEVHGPHGGKMWEDLTEEEKNHWIEKLKDGGHWTEDYTETILKGVFFSMAGAAIRGAVGG